MHLSFILCVLLPSVITKRAGLTVERRTAVPNLLSSNLWERAEASGAGGWALHDDWYVLQYFTRLVIPCVLRQLDGGSFGPILFFNVFRDTHIDGVPPQAWHQMRPG